MRNEYAPDSVTPPGATLAETLEAIGMTQTDLAQRTGRPLKTINEIVQGKTAITPETALQLERVLGISASFWQNRESRYRESLARASERRALEEQLPRLREVPVSEMQKRGWIPKTADQMETLRAVLAFFGVANVQALEERADALFRRSKVAEGNRLAVGAWLRRGHIEAQQIECRPYDERAFRDALDQARELTRSEPEDFGPRLREICAAAGVAVVFVPELKGTRAWGATRWLTPSKALVQLSLRYKTDDHFWFTFFHEAAHVLKHSKKEPIIETEMGEKDAREREADVFASEFLIPRAELSRLGSGPFSTVEVEALARRIGVAPGIVVGRLQHEVRLPRTHLNGLKRKLDLRELPWIPEPMAMV